MSRAAGPDVYDVTVHGSETSEVVMSLSVCDVAVVMAQRLRDEWKRVTISFLRPAKSPSDGKSTLMTPSSNRSRSPRAGRRTTARKRFEHAPLCRRSLDGFHRKVASLRDVLAARLVAHQHVPAPLVARRLGLTLTAIHAALAPLEQLGIINVTRRGEDAEAWHFDVRDGTVQALLDRVLEFERAGQLPRGILDAAVA